MELAMFAPLLIGAVGYSIIYLLLGGGLFGAILIFIVNYAIHRLVRPMDKAAS